MQPDWFEEWEGGTRRLAGVATSNDQYHVTKGSLLEKVKCLHSQQEHIYVVDGPKCNAS